MKHAHQIHRDRRAAILRRMREQAGGGLALVPTAPEVARNRDSHFPYRHDSYFYYLTGFMEPEAVVALIASDDGDRHVLFCRKKDEEREIWDGFRYGPEAAQEIFGFDEAYAIDELDGGFPTSRATSPALFTPLGLFEPWDRKVSNVLNEVRGRVRTGVAAPEQMVDIRAALDHMRLVKDEHELAVMRRAAAISSGAHRARDGAHAPGLARVPGRGRARARVPARTARRRSPIRRSSPPAPTPACCITARTTGAWPTASCC